VLLRYIVPNQPDISIDRNWLALVSGNGGIGGIGQAGQILLMRMLGQTFDMGLFMVQLPSALANSSP
jgi:hypothetical protein